MRGNYTKKTNYEEINKINKIKENNRKEKKKTETGDNEAREERQQRSDKGGYGRTIAYNRLPTHFISSILGEATITLLTNHY